MVLTLAYPSGLDSYMAESIVRQMGHLATTEG